MESKKLISADELREWLKKIPLHDLSDGRGLCRIIFADDFERAMKSFPGEAIEAKQIVHAHWVELTECANVGIYCSACTKRVFREDFAYKVEQARYCPNCGARMDGGDLPRRTNISAAQQQSRISMPAMRETRYGRREE